MENKKTSCMASGLERVPRCSSPVAWPPPWLADATAEPPAPPALSEPAPVAMASPTAPRQAAVAPGRLPTRLPHGAIGTGQREEQCRCGGREWVDVDLGGGKVRRDCLRCGRFVEFSGWPL